MVNLSFLSLQTIINPYFLKDTPNILHVTEAENAIKPVILRWFGWRWASYLLHGPVVYKVLLK